MLANIPHWEKRVWEYRPLFDDDFAYGLRDAKVILTDYRYVEEHLKKPRVLGHEADEGNGQKRKSMPKQALPRHRQGLFFCYTIGFRRPMLAPLTYKFTSLQLPA